MMNSKLAALIALCAFSSLAFADEARNARITSAINSVLPDIDITSIEPGPVPGLFEVMMGPSVLYVSEDGRFVVKGDIFDIKSLENITNNRRAAARIAAFEEVGVDGMIEFAPTNRKAAHTLYVYTDIDCAYCRKMHLEVEELNAAGIAVRYLAYPRTGLNGESYDKAVSVWCSKDRQSALTRSKAGKSVKSAECSNPVKSHYRMGGAMGVRGTPAVYSDDGESIGGYIPAKELVRMLNAREG